MIIENSKFTYRTCKDTDDSERFNEEQRENNIFGELENKKVKIKSFEMNKEVTGRIKRNPDNNRFVFFEGKQRSKFYNLTLGLYTGCFAMLTIKEIDVLA